MTGSTRRRAGRRLGVLLIVAAGAAVAAALVAPRQVGRVHHAVRWRAHAPVGHAFLAHAAAGDSAALARMSDGDQPVQWALAFGRHPAARAVAAARMSWGARVGADTVVLGYHVPARWCPGPDEPSTVQLRLVRRDGVWRVGHAGAEPC